MSENSDLSSRKLGWLGLQATVDKSLDIQFNWRYIYNPNMETGVFEYGEYDDAV
jgi:hypothetical protein